MHYVQISCNTIRRTIKNGSFVDFLKKKNDYSLFYLYIKNMTVLPIKSYIKDIKQIESFGVTYMED